jgi:MYXO-CTERM domain-containing protein
MQSLTTEAHGIEVDLGAFAAAIAYPADPFAAPDAPSFALSPSGAAVDKGTPLANVNDGFAGKAPDLGAIEAGQVEPVYGPGGNLGSGGSGGGAGVGGGSATGGSDAGGSAASSGVGGGTDGGGDSEDGCGCRVGSGRSGDVGALTALALMLVGVARRRRDTGSREDERTT